VNLHSYPSIFNLGHRLVADLLKTPVIVEENTTACSARTRRS
jgi:hypothetical protein